MFPRQVCRESERARGRERHPCVPRVNTIIPTFPFIRSTPPKHAATSRNAFLGATWIAHPFLGPPLASFFSSADPPRHCLKTDPSLSFSARRATTPTLLSRRGSSNANHRGQSVAAKAIKGAAFPSPSIPRCSTLGEQATVRQRCVTSNWRNFKEADARVISFSSEWSDFSRRRLTWTRSVSLRDAAFQRRRVAFAPRVY